MLDLCMFKDIGYNFAHMTFFRLSFCLFLCLTLCSLATLHKNYELDLHENFTRVVSVEKKQIIEFSKSSKSRNFKDLSHIARYCIFLQFGTQIDREGF